MLSYDTRAAEWRLRFDEQRASGLSVSAWCREQGIEKNTFYGWRKRLSESPTVSAPRFIALAVDRSVKVPPPASASLTLRIGRIAVEVASGFDGGLLCDVLDIVEPRAC